MALGIASASGSFDGRGETVVIRSDTRPAPVSEQIRATAPLRAGRFDPVAIYRARAGGVVTIYAFFDEAESDQHAAQGSGFVINGRGELLTSAHVVTTAGKGRTAEPAKDVYVAFRDGERVPAKIVGWDVYSDVALLRIDPNAHRIAPVPLGDSDRVSVGEPVAAIGSPFGNEESLSVGVVSGTRRSISSLTSRYSVVGAIQTDAPITHGNSGGPLLDARGRAIGISAQIRSESGRAEGVGFAVPINAAKRAAAQLRAQGRVAYAYVGIHANDLTPSLARHLGVSVRRGALVDRVEPNTPAASAGIHGGAGDERFHGVVFRRGGDVIVAIEGRPVRSADDLVRIVSEELYPHEVVKFTIVRDGKRRTVSVRLGERPANPPLEG